MSLPAALAICCHWTWHLAVLADATRWRSMGSRLRGSRARFDTGDLLLGLLLLVAVLAGVLVLSRLVARQERHRRHNNPRSLFRGLCRAHGLDRPSRRLLAQLARSGRLAHPAVLFLEPHRFEAHALGPNLRAKQADLEALRDRIFQRSDG